jgi:HAE1 family hydrophobic/amphiphilic exporter-1
MCVLFQSFLYPLVIMFSVPLATLGGFMGLAALHAWSMADPYIPDQKLDVLVMLGFIILIGVVVNNAILLVHQALNFMKGISDAPGIEGPQPPRIAITESVRTRVRPILMSLFTSVVGMLPLVIKPGAGSELYRGLGAVVLGGLIVSTVFTLVLVPLLMYLAIDVKQWARRVIRHDDVSQMMVAAVEPAPTSIGANGSTSPAHAAPRRAVRKD